MQPSGEEKKGQPRSGKRGATTQTVAQNIKHYRGKAGYTTRTLAEELTRIGFPVTHSVISQMENGRRRIDVDDLSWLAYALDTSVLALLLPMAEEENDVVGTSVIEEDTAGQAVARVCQLRERYPEWMGDAIDKATGAFWRRQLQGIRYVQLLNEARGREDNELDLLLGYSEASLIREREKEAEEDG